MGKKVDKLRYSRLQSGTGRDNSSSEMTFEQIKKFALKKEGSRSPSPLGRFNQNLEKNANREVLEFQVSKSPLTSREEAAKLGSSLSSNSLLNAKGAKASNYQKN